MEFSPRDFSLVVGANGSGKTNLGDSLDFVSEVFRDGLELAVARKGGYENISHRKLRRTRSGIGIGLSVNLSPADLRLMPRFKDEAEHLQLQIDVNFSFRAYTSAVRSDYEVESESIDVAFSNGGPWTPAAMFHRVKSRATRALYIEQPKRAPKTAIEYLIAGPLINEMFDAGLSDLPPTELMINALAPFVPAFNRFKRAVSNARVYQINTSASRAYAPPTPSPRLGQHGDNLPAVVLDLQKRHEDVWNETIETMQRIIPELQAIEVKNTPSRTLGLSFLEIGVGRPWSVEDVSDGTMQTLATLVAINDPATTFVMLEEPENAVHPWILRTLLEAFAKGSKSKQVVLTSHSPIVIGRFPPENVSVMWRQQGESHIAALLSLDGKLTEKWKRGDINTFQFLDSGTISEAVPPNPQLDLLLSSAEDDD